MTTRKISSASALANTLGLDPVELPEYRYHAGRGTRAVYAIDDKYYIANKRVPKADQLPDHLDTLIWTPHSDQFWAQQANTIVWVGTSTR